MYARNQQYKYNKEPVTGGQPITAEQAKVSKYHTHLYYLLSVYCIFFIEFLYFVFYGIILNILD